MKVKVTVAVELDLPDEFVIGKQPEGFPCLRKGDKMYEPDIRWLIRVSNLEDQLFRPNEDPSLHWTSVADDTANFFIESTTLQEYRIDPM